MDFRSHSVRILLMSLTITLVAALPSHLVADDEDESSARPPRPRLQIFNGGTDPLQVFWLNDQGERIPQSEIKPGDDTVITTTLGHRFAVVAAGEPEMVVVSRRLVQAYRHQPGASFESRAMSQVRPNVVLAPPKELGAPAFYTKFISANGYPIVASANVNDYALKEAAFLANLLLDRRPDVRAALIESGSRMCIIGRGEFTTDLPEFSQLKAPAEFKMLADRDYWDARARGTGGSATDPYCSCGEENLLGYPGDPYSTESILIHEFAHTIHLRGLANTDPTFDARLKLAYDSAMKAGLWAGKYPSVNRFEYFAEGVQSWFDNNREHDHDHNHVNTRKELVDYDPALAALCKEVFGDTVLKYTKPATRLVDHMEGYNPADAPAFVWPDRLKNAKRIQRESVEARNERAKRTQPPASP